jgi:DNA-binding NtrC family response regulator
LVLDEVGELPEEAQAKLLRALESGEVRRVGAATPTWPDARIVAATNRNLAEAVKQGKFRGDLYFRLAVLAVRLPPLRERPEDIPAIAEAVVKRLHPTLSLAPDAVDLLTRHPWPGNARELRNVLTRAWVLGGEAHIAARHIAFDPLDERAQAVAPKQVEDDERELIEEALRRHGGNRSQAARTLGMARSTLLYKLRRWGLEG